MNIRKNLVDSSRYSLKCPYSMKVEYVTYHNTDNNASADAEVRNVKRLDNNAKVSFHVAVDEKEAVQVIPFDRNAFAAGDGKDGTGNRKSIHVEICKNELGANNSTFKKCEDNAVEVCAQLLKENGLSIDKLKPHKYWSGKNCPSTTNHKDFEKRVKDKLVKLNKTEFGIKVYDFNTKESALEFSNKMTKIENAYNYVAPNESKWCVRIESFTTKESAANFSTKIKQKYNAWNELYTL
ncbi:MAG: peptidoglycan recognition protein family protein [Clostridium sp.]